MPNTKTYKVNNELYNIPVDKERELFESYPEAMEVHPYEVGGERYGIPINKVDDFLDRYPDAKDLKKKESSFRTVATTPGQKLRGESVSDESDLLSPSGTDQKVPYEDYEPETIDFPEEERKIAEKQRQERKEREAYFDKLKTEVTPVIQENLSHINNEIDKITTNPDYFTGVDPEQMSTPEYGYIRSKQLRNYRTARNILKSADKFIEASDKKGLKSFVEGLKSKNTVDLLTLGLNETFDNIDMAFVAKKQREGRELTEDEQLALFSRYIMNELKSGKDTPSGYNIGNILVEMVPYLSQIALTGGVSSSVKAGLQRTVKSKIKNSFTGKVLQEGIATAAQVPFFWSMYGQAAERTIGDLEQTGEGEIDQKEGTGESAGEALKNAYLNTYSEVFPEKLGMLFARTKPLTSGNISKLKKSADDIKKTFKWDGIAAEFGEEQLTTVMQTITTGDASLSDLIDIERQFETFVSIAAMGGAFRVLETPGYVAERLHTKKLSEAEKDLKDIPEDVKRDIDEAITMNNISSMREALDNIGLDGFNSKQQGNIIRYVKEKIENSAIESVEERFEESPEIDSETQFSDQQKQKITQEQTEVEQKPQEGGIEDGRVRQDEKEEKEQRQEADEEVDTPQQPAETLQTGEDVSEQAEAPLSTDQVDVVLETKPTPPSLQRVLKTSDKSKTSDIKVKDKEVGQVTVDENWKVKRVDVDPDFQRQGIAKNTYRKLNEEAGKENEVLRSDQPDKINDESKRIWDSLINTNEARKLEDGSYEFIKSEDYVKEAKTKTQETVTEEGVESGQQEVSTELPRETEQVEDTGQVEKVAYTFAGNREAGEVVERTKDKIKVKSLEDGMIHNIPLNRSSTAYKDISFEQSEIDNVSYSGDIQEKLTRKIGKIDKRKKKESELRQDILDRATRINKKLGGIKEFAAQEGREGKKDPSIAEDLFGIVADFTELGLIKLDEGIEHVMDTLKNNMPADYQDVIEDYRKDIAEKYGLEYKPPKKTKEKVERKEVSKEEAVSKLSDIRNKRNEEINKRRKSVPKRFQESLRRGFVDKTENYKMTLKRLNKEEAQRALDYFNLKKGASGKSRRDLHIARSKVLGDVKEGKSMYSLEKQELLADYIDAIRTKELDQLYDSRGEERLEHEGGMTLEDANQIIQAIENKDPSILSEYDIKDYDIADLKDRANNYFAVMQGILDDVHDAGLIGSQLYEKLKKEQPFYSRRKYIQHINDVYSVGSDRITTIDQLSEGSSGSKIVDLQELMADAIVRKNNSIFTNNANKELANFVVNNPNELIRLAEYSDDYVEKVRENREKSEEDQEYIEPSFKETPSGFSLIPYIENGYKKGMWMDNDLYNEMQPADVPDHTKRVLNMLSWVTMTKPLKMAATGYNPEFMVKNIGLDSLYTLTVSPEYSTLYPVGALQLGKDMISIVSDLVRRKGDYIDYIDEGGALDFLTHQGGVDLFRIRKHTKMSSGLEALGDGLQYIGLTSEMLTRLAHRRRYINNRVKEFKKENGREPSQDEMKDIQVRGTAFARGQLDFSQGGHFTKTLDYVMPYLNSGFQVTRGVLRASKDNPKKFWSRMFQLGAVATGITAYNMGRYPWGDDEEKERRKQAYLNEIPDGVKARNFVVMTNVKYKDEAGNERYVYYKYPKDPFQQSITGLFEGSYLRFYEGIDNSLINKQRWLEFQGITRNVSDLASLPPIATGAIGYKTNTDLFYDTPLWYGRDQGEKQQYEYIPGKTDTRFVWFGEKTGLSPVRSQYFMQQIFTRSNVIGTMLGEGLDLMIDADEETNQLLNRNVGERLTNAPFSRRYFSVSNPYVQIQEVKKYQQELNRERTKNDHRLDEVLNNKEYKAMDVIDVIYEVAQQNPGEARRLSRRWADKETDQDINPKIKAMVFMSPEARAKAFLDMYHNSHNKTKFIEESYRAGVMTKSFSPYLRDAILDDDKLNDKERKSLLSED